MAGGKSDDPNVFNPDIFSFRRITLAPDCIVVRFRFRDLCHHEKTKKQQLISSFPVLIIGVIAIFAA
ncbi:MAG: DUF3098 domain-containing protein [Marinilabiliales bacterium]|nr:DUF3098 domain-containing protein [Marinilabiliales bacterium]